jgi:hypothetical protein
MSQIPYSYYDILQIRMGASDEQIRAAYREQARYYHPDITTLDPEVAASKLKIINEAYETLKDAQRRVAYDEELAYERDRALLGLLPSVLAALAEGSMKGAWDQLKNLENDFGETDLLRGLQATTLHLQARNAYQAGKFGVARKFLQQALAVPFEESELRGHIEADLGLVSDRAADQEGPTTTDPAPLLASIDPLEIQKGLDLLTTVPLDEAARHAPRLRHLLVHGLYRSVRVGALRALVGLAPEDQDNLHALRQFYLGDRPKAGKQAPPPAERLAALAVKEKAAIAPALLPFLREGDTAMRTAVLNAWQVMANPKTLPWVRPWLLSEADPVRGAAAKTLDALEGKVGLAGRLLSMVGVDDGVRRADKRVETLEEADREQLDLEVAFWEKPARRPQLLKAWAAGAEVEDLPGRIYLALRDRKGATTHAVGVILTKLGPELQAPLVGLLRDEDWLMRRIAAELIGVLRVNAGRDGLLALLDDAKPPVRRAALMSLAEVGDASCLPKISPYANDDDPGVAEAARTAVGKLRPR